MRSVLSYLSPFRSSSKAQRTEEQAETEEESLEEGADTDVKEEDTDSADEAAQFALHGRQITREASAGIVSLCLSLRNSMNLSTHVFPVYAIVRTASSSFSYSRTAIETNPRAVKSLVLFLNA